MHADLIKCRLHEYNVEDSTRAILKNKHIKINKIIHMLYKSILYFTSYNLLMFFVLFFFNKNILDLQYIVKINNKREQTQFMLNKNG